MSLKKEYFFESEFDRVYDSLLEEVSEKSIVFENKNKQSQLSKLLTNKVVLYIRENYSVDSKLVDDNKTFVCYIDKSLDKTSPSKLKIDGKQYCGIYIIEKNTDSFKQTAFYSNLEKNIYIVIDKNVLRNLTTFSQTEDGYESFYSSKEFMRSCIRHELQHFLDSEFDVREFKELVRQKFSSKTRIKNKYLELFLRVENENDDFLKIDENQKIMDTVRGFHTYLLNEMEICSHIVETNSYINNFTFKKYGYNIYLQRLIELTTVYILNKVKKTDGNKIYYDKLVNAIVDLNIFVLSVYITAYIIKYPESKKFFVKPFKFYEQMLKYDFNDEFVVKLTKVKP